jgi:hypothetical protein
MLICVNYVLMSLFIGKSENGLKYKNLYAPAWLRFNYDYFYLTITSEQAAFGLAFGFAHDKARLKGA